MNARFFFAAVCCLALVTVTQAALVIDVGTHYLAPDTTNAVITINVTGGDAVDGLNFYMQVGDGGSANGGSDTTPIIMDVDPIAAGTIFHGNNIGVSPDEASQTPGLIWYIGTAVNSGTVSAEGVLAYVTIDTTGTTAGEEYDLLMTDVGLNLLPPNGYTTYFDAPSPVNRIDPVIMNGTIHITPEPASLTLLGAAGLGVLLRRRRKYIQY